MTHRYVYSGPYRVVAEVDGTGAVASRYVYASGGIGPDVLLRGGRTYGYVKSYLGSVRLVVDVASGAVVQSLEYDAWGRVLADSNPGFQPFGFAGGLYDAEVGLVHFGFRDYDPTTGTWTAKDPLRWGAAAGAYLSPEPLLQSPSYVEAMALQGHAVPTYAYALNNPLRYVDRDGLAPWRIAARVAGAGIRLLGRISEAAARSLVRHGGDVATDSERAAEAMARKISNSAGGGGRCVGPEAHGAGAKHFHPLGPEGERVEGMGHVFFKDLSMIPLIILDPNDNGSWLDEGDLFEYVNPFPTTLDDYNGPDSPFGLGPTKT